MSEKQWYESLFENYGQKYDSEGFVGGTMGECDFIEAEIQGEKTCRILDVGCGTGRHSIELAKRGYPVVGIDLSLSLLTQARKKAKAEDVAVSFLQQDARRLPFRAEFNAVIMLCEGGFPLMETDEMNFAILKSIATALKEGGKFIFTTLNGLFPLFHSVESFLSPRGQIEGNTTYRSEGFDLMTFREIKTIEVVDDNNCKKVLQSNERYYVPSEITWLLRSLGYHNIDIFGAKLGAFSRKDKLTTNDFEMLVVADK